RSTIRTSSRLDRCSTPRSSPSASSLPSILTLLSRGPGCLRVVGAVLYLGEVGPCGRGVEHGASRSGLNKGLADLPYLASISGAARGAGSHPLHSLRCLPEIDPPFAVVELALPPMATCP